jgi:hypothetical protein
VEFVVYRASVARCVRKSAGLRRKRTEKKNAFAAKVLKKA